MRKPYVIELQKIGQAQCDIMVGEYQKHIPFDVRRFYIIDNRGEAVSEHGSHALKETEQAYVALNGTAVFDCLDRQGGSYHFELTSMDRMLFLPEMTWRTVTLSAGATLVCLTSRVYDTGDYIKDKTEFITKV